MLSQSLIPLLRVVTYIYIYMCSLPERAKIGEIRSRNRIRVDPLERVGRRLRNPRGSGKTILALESLDPWQSRVTSYQLHPSVSPFALPFLPGYPLSRITCGSTARSLFVFYGQQSDRYRHQLQQHRTEQRQTRRNTFFALSRLRAWCIDSLGRRSASIECFQISLKIFV